MFFSEMSKFADESPEWLANVEAIKEAPIIEVKKCHSELEKVWKQSILKNLARNIPKRSLWQLDKQNEDLQAKMQELERLLQMNQIANGVDEVGDTSQSKSKHSDESVDEMMALSQSRLSITPNGTLKMVKGK